MPFSRGLGHGVPREQIQPLTEEEKKEKLAELRAKMAAKRAVKAEEDAKEALANEKIRRKQGNVGRILTTSSISFDLTLVFRCSGREQDQGRVEGKGDRQGS